MWQLSELHFRSSSAVLWRIGRIFGLKSWAKWRKECLLCWHTSTSCIFGAPNLKISHWFSQIHVQGVWTCMFYWGGSCWRGSFFVSASEMGVALVYLYQGAGLPSLRTYPCPPPVHILFHNQHPHQRATLVTDTKVYTKAPTQVIKHVDLYMTISRGSRASFIFQDRNNWGK